MSRLPTLWEAFGHIWAHQTKVRFLIAGAFNTLFGLAVFPILIWGLRPLHLHYMIALTLSQIICVTFAYMNSKHLVFLTRGNYLREYGKFISFHVITFALNLAALPFMVEIIGFRPVIAQSLFAVAIIVSSYFWHSRVTFRLGKLTVG